MKTASLLFALLCGPALGFAQESFPGLKELLTEQEWKRAGLDQLSPDQLGVIDAALIRHQAKLAQAAKAQVTEARAAEVAGGSPEARKKSWLERFGFPIGGEDDWKTTPPLKAKVVAWQGGNRFLLDNGQVWEGSEAIPYDLPGKEIEIQARPNHHFSFSVDGKNTSLRIYRVR